jgi:hypothetical protein
MYMIKRRMKVVKFLVQGQFGNNLFQYFASEIIKKIYAYDEVKPTFEINLEFNTIIDDTKFKRIINAYLNGDKVEIDTSKDILMIGFFQRSEIFLKEREFIRSLFVEDNMSNISNRIKIGNIVKYQTKHTIEPTENDLVLHVRLAGSFQWADFIDMENKTSQLYEPDRVKEIIKGITYDKLYIVCNTPKADWEKEYLSEFDELNPIIVSAGLGDDFDFMLKAKKFITSASTMSWMAAMLGNANELHIPYNTYYGGFESNSQSLAECSETAKLYKDMTYWFPKRSDLSQIKTK